jgi:hypothetical protein
MSGVRATHLTIAVDPRSNTSNTRYSRTEPGANIVHGEGVREKVLAVDLFDRLFSEKQK